MTMKEVWYVSGCCGTYWKAKPSELWDLINPCACLSLKRRRANKEEIAIANESEGE